ncbi:DEAD/DEAH box helicase [Streptococcus dentapri]|uniref:DEAD/DEAH box helicase n=1 Tax=Streptococcus dentapri TaxID=573564 RepID=A0ABV8D082_9STRE
MDHLENYYGRQFLDYQLSPKLKARAYQFPATFKKADQLYCRRCNSRLLSEWCLPDGSYYCRNCIVFGRITTDNKLCYFPQENFKRGNYLNWQGQLTSYQAEISALLVSAVKARENILVHAVTGSGKTEMIYKVVSLILDKGASVALVSPRIDVCRELYQRFKRDFTCHISLLHTDSEEYHRAPLLISTVHQLFKFYQAFDLIIIDEVDAFPYADDKVLYQAVANALKSDGSKIFLTATSTDHLDKEVKKGRLRRVHLARRFHAYPLVVPRPVWLSNIEKAIKNRKLPSKLHSDIARQRKTGYPLLVFYPTIKEGEEFGDILKTNFPDERIGFVSSQMENRLKQVQDFREGELDILISTTILERGVTFPEIDVFILNANHRLYTKSALVQISGRVGRSDSRPIGLLNFYHDGISKQMKKAIKDIKEMNKRGGL